MLRIPFLITHFHELTLAVQEDCVIFHMHRYTQRYIAKRL